MVTEGLPLLKVMCDSDTLTSGLSRMRQLSDDVYKCIGQY